jgi:hypothetical protein
LSCKEYVKQKCVLQVKFRSVKCALQVVYAILNLRITESILVLAH